MFLFLTKAEKEFFNYSQVNLFSFLVDSFLPMSVSKNYITKVVNSICAAIPIKKVFGEIIGVSLVYM